MQSMSRRSSAWKLFLFFSAMLLVAAPLGAQKTPATVNVLATVHDAQGHVVANLNKDDFTVEEDGRPQTIRSFTAAADLPLSLGLLVETSRGQSHAIGQEKKATGTFASGALREGKDASFLIHFDREVDLLQDLTTSREKTVSALDKLRVPDGRTRQRPEPDGGGVLFDAIFLASDELLQKQPGRKAIIVLTDGVDSGSKTSLERALEAAQRANTIIYSIYAPAQSGPSSGWDRNIGNGPGYGPPWGGGYPGGGYPGGGWPGGGYPGGGYPGGGAPGGGSPGGGTDSPRHQTSPEVARVILDRLSRETGGRMFEVSKKTPLDQIYKQIEDDLRSQYDLGYTSDHAADAASEYRRIQVTVKPKDMTVQARDGYYPAQQVNARLTH